MAPQPFFTATVALSLPANLGIGLAGVAAGIALLLWGRWAGRGVFVLAGAAVGWFLGGLLAGPLGVDPTAVRVVAAVVSASLALLLTPLLWALTAGAVTASVVLFVLILQQQPDFVARAPAIPAAGQDAWDYLAAIAKHLGKGLSAAWDHEGSRLAIIAGVIGGVPFLIGAIRLRLATIFMSSVCGGMAVAAGLAGLAGTAAPSIIPALWKSWFVFGGAGAAMGVVGIGVQYRRALKADKDKDNREGEPPEPKATEKKETA
jgi:hypothetical protein